ncbi:dTDP-4-dehydrorhamnose 3,5-epimerase [Leptospira fluminis]|uniref:dTDP-4-dehydrorhamnose 3,5-epimerase n=1 Tax=Leptospira fluminis TaxID=2484979 RepID=A0A4R9GM25_9LEPT|nr:dTDP-4-dehydrorhamnose 3,5-epimerase [Leptospira fluminis]TGK17278.1 dTDP-4-dehydrorhamnose 3,5-epimerase [Leptospira fluminis]
MKFNETPLKGAYTIDLEKKGDDRGFFARMFCANEFQELGLDFSVVQVNNSLSDLKGTLRGMHYQLEPYAESKIVRCIKGSLYDIILDLRKDSLTFGKWFGAELSEENRKMMFVPKGFAHGFITLRDGVEAIYFVTNFYNQEAERGVRWNDKRFGIEWPLEPKVLSEKDKLWPDFDPTIHLK